MFLSMMSLRCREEKAMMTSSRDSMEGKRGKKRPALTRKEGEGKVRLV